jgi:hypothetical protein
MGDLECGEALPTDEEYQLLKFEMAVLSTIPGCSGAGESNYNGPDLNKMDVHVRVLPPGETSKKMIRRSCSAEFDTKLKAAREVKRRVALVVGSEVVSAAEEQLRGGSLPTASVEPQPVPITPSELEWLAEWIDEQMEPDLITCEQADAALASRRQREAGALTLSKLQRMQWLEARLRAGELRISKAQAVAARIRSEIDFDIGPAEKAARVEQSASVPLHPRATTDCDNPPHWNVFHSYTKEKYQELEVKEQDRRAVAIVRSNTVVDLAPGDDTRGWFRHWRRGVYGALLSWAAGSIGAIICMLAFCVKFFGVEKEVPLSIHVLSLRTCCAPVSVCAVLPPRPAATQSPHMSY